MTDEFQIAVASDTIFTCFSLQDFTRPYCEACSIKVVGDHWLGGQMSVRDFLLPFARTIFGSGLARGKVAPALAACLACAGVSDGHATANRFAEFPTAATFAPGSAEQANDLPLTSFNERFDSLRTARIPDIHILHILPADLVPLAPLTTGSVSSPRKIASLPRHDGPASPPRRQKIVAAGTAIVGIASVYNPVDPKDIDAGNEELASGERYDPDGWTAAIQTKLRAKFGGVRFGKNYQPFYALVQANDKQAIVRINDVGPLRRGRIIDLNLRTMRYFDPTLELGLIGKVKVTPLAGQNWALGPLVDEQPVAVASRTDRQTR